MRTLSRALGLPVFAICFCSLACSSGSDLQDAGVDDAGTDAGGDEGGDEGSDAGGDQGQVGPPNAMRACSDLLGILCEHVIACQMIPGVDIENCMGAFAEFDCASLAVSAEMGRIAYSREDAAACLHAAADLPCDSLFGILVNLTSLEPACGRMFSGQVEPGGACYTPYDCAGGRCVSDSCPGECAAYVGLGQSCSSAEDRYCEPDSAFCDDVCTARRPAGGDCRTALQCQPGLICVSGQCSAYRGESEPCDPDSSMATGCAWPYYCDQDTSRCTARKTQDQQCRQPIDLLKVNGECVHGLECIDGACSEIGGPNDPCEPDLTVSCELDLYCDSATSRCTPKPTQGEDCDDYERPCAGLDLYCDPTTDRCAARKGEGSDCADDDECQSDLSCIDGHCEDSPCW
ncbi:MAG: hypothetical protein JXR96_22040 [Deltaproteobacteria bacterium]|nr:hypothetical protein [Deltaproteobacteria bacterium]